MNFEWFNDDSFWVPWLIGSISIPAAPGWRPILASLWSPPSCCTREQGDPGGPQRSRADPGRSWRWPHWSVLCHIFLSHFKPYISEDIPIYSRCSWGSQFTKWDAPPSWRPVAFQDGSADFSERCCWFVYLYLIDVIWTLQPNFWYPMLIDKSSNFDFLHVR